MAGFTLQENGFTRTPELAYALVSKLLANGFVQKFPVAPLQAPVVGTPYDAFTCTLEASPTVDPLSTTQPWRIAFATRALDDQQMDIYVASPLQLPDNGTVATLDVTESGGNVLLPAGMINVAGNLVSNSGDDSEQHFISRNYAGRVTSPAIASSYPMSYALSVTDHGIVISVWEEAASTAKPNFTWLTVQRPVNSATGAPLVVGHCPVVCLFSLASKPYKFIVRENDILKPTKPVSASIDTEDSHAIMNNINQVAITENNRYVITFPNGLNTPRYMYTEELDLVAYTSADVVSQYSDVPLTVYGEAEARTYKAMPASAANNTGMRILMITKGASIL